MSSDAAYVVASLALTGATATWSICLLGVLVRGSAVLWYVAAAPLCRSAALPAADSSAPRAQVLNLIVVKSKALERVCGE